MIMTQPMNPADYVASQAVHLVIGMIIESRIRDTGITWITVGERQLREQQFHNGTRWQLDVVLRALVEQETNITDPDDLDELCADLIDAVLENAG
jgi:hypothetical protein